MRVPLGHVETLPIWIGWRSFGLLKLTGSSVSVVGVSWRTYLQNKLTYTKARS